MWPASFWEKYEYFIRKSAGLGKSPTKPDQDIYDHRYMHCDVLVVGGGISGLYAAALAAQANLKVLIFHFPKTMKQKNIYILWELKK